MKKTKFLSALTLLIIVLISVTSCVSKKDIIYMQDIDNSLSDSNQAIYNTKISNDDILRIIILSENMESVQPFNKVVNPVASGGLAIRSQEMLQSYLVDEQGNINYPLIGSIKVSGLTRSQLEKNLQKKLLKYVKDATVDVRILNFKITVLGEVNRPGTFSVSDSRITLLQAIGLAGDLSVYGKRSNIIVLRDDNGIQKSARVDITTSDFIYSPYYYLNQNDTVIVEPNGAQVQASGFNRNISVYVSIASLLLTTIVVLSNLNK